MLTDRGSPGPPPYGVLGARAQYFVCLYCRAFSDDFLLTFVRENVWVPAGISRGTSISLPDFDYERLAALRVFVNFEIEELDWDAGSWAYTVSLAGVLLPPHLSAEELALVVGVFKEAGWTISAGKHWAKTWDRCQCAYGQRRAAGKIETEICPVCGEDYDICSGHNYDECDDDNEEDENDEEDDGDTGVGDYPQ